MNLKPMDKVKWDMLPGVYTVIQIMKQYGVTYLRGEDGMIRQAEIEDLHKYTPSRTGKYRDLQGRFRSKTKLIDEKKLEELVKKMNEKTKIEKLTYVYADKYSKGALVEKINEMIEIQNNILDRLDRLEGV